MRFRLSRVVRRMLIVATYCAAGVLLALVVVFIVYLESRPDLDVWHLAELDVEYTATSGVETL